MIQLLQSFLLPVFDFENGYLHGKNTAISSAGYRARLLYSL